MIREAVRYLEAEGLVDNSARGGPVVARMDWPQARQIYDIRLLLEADAAAECARRADAAVKETLTQALADLNQSFADGAPIARLEATTRFYSLIFQAAGKEVAWEVVNRLNSRISRLRALTLDSSDRTVTGPAHMARICQAICDNAPDQAASAVRTHLRGAAEIAERLLNAPD